MSLDEARKKILANLDPEARKLVEKVLNEQQAGKQDTYKLLRQSLFVSEPPPMDNFLYDKNYLGLPRGSIYPSIEELIYLVDDPTIRNCVVAAGKGAGKSTLCSITLARQTHNVAVCMRDPSAYFGLLPDTLIAVINMCTSAEQAENQIFNKLWNMFRNAGCFKDGLNNLLFEKRKRHIVMPNNIHVLSGHSNYRVFYGYDVFAGVIDEVDYYEDNEEHDISGEIYQALQSSAETRFPGFYKLLAISSPKSMDGFVMSRVQEAEARTDTKYLVREIAGDERGNKPIS